MQPAFQPARPLPSRPLHTPCRPARLALSPRRPGPRSVRAAIAPTSSAAEGKTPEYRLAPGEIAVRFINTPAGADVVAAANEGDGLLNVGDSVGVHIPRACQTGLCGSCTCDILDAGAEDGRQTVRACMTGVVIPDDGSELVVDVERMRTARKGPDPMARFENMDTEYVAGKAPRIKGGRGVTIESVDCPECAASGDAECYQCDGEGVEEHEGMSNLVCALCGGSGALRCADCQGTGTIQVRR